MALIPLCFNSVFRLLGSQPEGPSPLDPISMGPTLEIPALGTSAL